jgi:hypothetical protein
MDRRTRPTVARRRIAGALAVALGTAGCSSNSYVMYSSGSSAAGAPTGTSAYVQGSTSSSSAAFAALFLLHWSLLNERWDRGAGMYGSSTIPAPPMDETRAVNMQDCTQPIEDWSANLKCR